MQGNHYLFYFVAGRPQEAQAVLTRGQFDDDYVKALIGPLELFGNPVVKWHAGGRSPIEDELAHLSWRRLQEEAPPHPRPVRIENQFGRQHLDIGPAVALLSPARKQEAGDGHRPPDGDNRYEDHYKVYFVHASMPVHADLALADQFMPRGERFPAALGQAQFLAVPVTKRHGDTESPIRSEERHLVIYDVAGPRPRERRLVYDQFHPEGTSVDFSYPVFLAVPSKKRWRRRDMFTTTDDAIDHISLTYRNPSDHHILEAYNHHRTKSIEAEFSWTWDPEEGEPESGSCVATILPGGSSGYLAFHYGKGRITDYKTKGAVYVK